MIVTVGRNSHFMTSSDPVKISKCKPLQRIHRGLGGLWKLWIKGAQRICSDFLALHQLLVLMVGDLVDCNFLFFMFRHLWKTHMRGVAPGWRLGWETTSQNSGDPHNPYGKSCSSPGGERLQEPNGRLFGLWLCAGRRMGSSPAEILRCWRSSWTRGNPKCTMSD